MIFLSTPSARRATDALPTLSTAWMISIHALREEGDSGSGSSAADSYNISIHALREEGDVAAKVGIPWLRISIHALREEGDMLGMATQRSITISIHALREEGDFRR